MAGGPFDILALLDPLGLGIVLGGATLAAAMRATRAEIAGAIAALRPMLRADPEVEAQAARRIVNRVEAIAEARGLACSDRAGIGGAFLREAIQRLADASDAEAYARWADETLAARRRRHAGAAGFWCALADAAPAMGMIATVIGLIRMFSRLDDPARIGQPMATALIATLAGLIVANLIAGPIAERLERLSEAELAWQRRSLDHFVGLARAELVRKPGRPVRGVAA